MYFVVVIVLSIIYTRHPYVMYLKSVLVTDTLVYKKKSGTGSYTVDRNLTAIFLMLLTFTYTSFIKHFECIAPCCGGGVVSDA